MFAARTVSSSKTTRAHEPSRLSGNGARRILRPRPSPYKPSISPRFPRSDKRQTDRPTSSSSSLNRRRLATGYYVLGAIVRLFTCYYFFRFSISLSTTRHVRYCAVVRRTVTRNDIAYTRRGWDILHTCSNTKLQKY